MSRRDSSKVGGVSWRFIVFMGLGLFLLMQSMQESPESFVKEEDPQPQVWPPPGDGEPLSAASRMLASNVYIVMDASGSMEQTGCSGELSKASAAKEALTAFVGTIPAETNVGLLIFDAQGVSERTALSSGDRGALLREISLVEPAGGTPLRSAISLARERLEIQARAQQGYGEYRLVIVTDGEANDGEEPTAVVSQILRDTPITIHTIGFCIDTRHSLNQPGRVQYVSANSVHELTQGLQETLAESAQFSVDSFTGTPE
jgi:Ca-activated chloride channel family protein